MLTILEILQGTLRILGEVVDSSCRFNDLGVEVRDLQENLESLILFENHANDDD